MEKPGERENKGQERYLPQKKWDCKPASQFCGVTQSSRCMVDSWSQRTFRATDKHIRPLGKARAPAATACPPASLRSSLACELMELLRAPLAKSNGFYKWLQRNPKHSSFQSNPEFKKTIICRELCHIFPIILIVSNHQEVVKKFNIVISIATG